MGCFSKIGKEEKKCKGIKKGVVKKNITQEDYKDCLFTQNVQMRKMNVIRSHQHEIFSETIHKKALSANDDNTFIREDGTSTYAHGHKDIESERK